MRTRAIDAPVTAAELRPAGRRARRWPWLIGGVALAFLKANAYLALVHLLHLHHRVDVMLVLGFVLAHSVLRPRPVWIAVTIAALLAFALHPRSTALGIALGFGAFALLLALFVAIAASLHAWQARLHTRKCVSFTGNST